MFMFCSKQVYILKVIKRQAKLYWNIQEYRYNMNICTYIYVSMFISSRKHVYIFKIIKRQARLASCTQK